MQHFSQPGQDHLPSHNYLDEIVEASYSQSVPVKNNLNDQLALVENLTRFSRQKPGGTFQPEFSRSSPYCILCSNGSTCLGPYCLGSAPERALKSVLPRPPDKSFCPGLTGGAKMSSLIELKFEESKKTNQACSVLHYGHLFGWSSKPNTSNSVSSSNSSSSSETPGNSHAASSESKRVSQPCVRIPHSNHCSTNVYAKKALQSILRKSGAKNRFRNKKVTKDSAKLSSSVNNGQASSPVFSSSSLKQPEILRSSPQQGRPLSPDTPKRTRSKGHTPRKDTPKKNKDKRLQCRNQNCRVWFTSSKSRVRHETQTCKILPDRSTDVTLEAEHIVPEHGELNLSSLQCRFPGCQREYLQEQHRKRHEQDCHRMFEKRGRTVSPASFPPPPPQSYKFCYSEGHANN